MTSSHVFVFECEMEDSNEEAFRKSNIRERGSMTGCLETCNLGQICAMLSMDIDPLELTNGYAFIELTVHRNVPIQIDKNGK